jgi:large subunit ribosomal protein L14e
MIEIGRLCVKLAGRDAGKKCVVIEVLEENFVMIDGETRRRKCNIIHLEPLDEVLKVKEKASHADVTKAFKNLGIELKETKKKEAKPRPRKVRKKKEKKEAPKKKAAKKEEKKVEKPKEKKEDKPAATSETKVSDKKETPKEAKK